MQQFLFKGNTTGKMFQYRNISVGHDVGWSQTITFTFLFQPIAQRALLQIHIDNNSWECL